MTENKNLSRFDFNIGSFYTIYQLNCAKCEDVACLDTSFETSGGYFVAIWADLINIGKQKGWYVNKKAGVALCPNCREEEGL